MKEYFSNAFAAVAENPLRFVGFLFFMAIVAVFFGVNDFIMDARAADLETGPASIEYPSGLSYPAALDNIDIYSGENGVIAIHPMSGEKPGDSSGTKYAIVTIIDHRPTKNNPAGKVLNMLYLRELSRPNAAANDSIRYDGEQMGNIISVDFADARVKTGLKIEYEVLTFGRDKDGKKDLKKIETAVYENKDINYSWLIPFNPDASMGNK